MNEESKRRREAEAIIDQAAGQISNELNKSSQDGTTAAMDGMSLFQYKAGKLHNVHFEQGKGFMLEYLENAKLERNLANAGYGLPEQHFVTDAPTSMRGIQNPHSPYDFKVNHTDGTYDLAQAKYNNSPAHAAHNFVNDKYYGMERVAPIDQMNDIKRELDGMLIRGQISQKAYNDAVANLQWKGLTDSSSGISSGGTTTIEIESLKGRDGKISPEKVSEYAQRFQNQQYIYEITDRSVKGAVSSGIIAGLVAGTKNLFEVYQDKKKLNQALKEIGVETGKATVRGGIMGFLSSLIRIGGETKQIPLLKDGSAATVMAGCILDCGIAIYEYTKGNITTEQLTEEMQNTVVKGTATIYFTKAASAALGATGVFLPIAVYTASSYAIMAMRDIIRHSKLAAAEYRRVTALYQESAQTIRKYRQYMETQMSQYKDEQRELLEGFIESFEYNAKDKLNYDRAITAMLCFANRTGIVLQHHDFKEFQAAMRNNGEFVLR